MNNKVVVIVGATGGIGSAVAQKLANSGANLVLAARDNNRLDALATQLSTTEIITVPTNITNSQEVEILMEKASQYFGKRTMRIHRTVANYLPKMQSVPRAHRAPR